MEKIVEQYNLQWPDDIDKRFRSITRSPDELKQWYPDVETFYSYWSIAAHIWVFIRDQLKLDCFPPPVIIDMRDDVSLPRAYNETGELYSWINAAFNHAGTTISRIDGYPDAYAPLDYEIRIFHYNMLQEIQNNWGKHPTDLAIKLTVTHTIIHEMCHFLILYWKYRDTLDNTSESFQMLLAHIENSNDVLDEYVTEELAIAILIRYWLNIPFNIVDLGEVVLGGPYDMWRRQRDDNWLIIATYIQKMEIQNQLTGAKLDSAQITEYHKQLKAIETCHADLMKKYRNEAVKFMLVE